MDLASGDTIQDLCVQAGAGAGNSDVRISVQKIQYATGGNLEDSSVTGKGALGITVHYLAPTDDKDILAFDLPC